jgi:hypothetical protein
MQHSRHQKGRAPLGNGAKVGVLSLSVHNGQLMLGLDGETPHFASATLRAFDARDWVVFFGNTEEHHANDWAESLLLDIKDRRPVVVPERTFPSPNDPAQPSDLKTRSKRRDGASSSDGGNVIKKAKGAQEEAPVDQTEWAYSYCTDCGVPDCCLRCNEMSETVSALRQEIADLKTKINRMTEFTLAALELIKVED